MIADLHRSLIVERSSLGVERGRSWDEETQGVLLAVADGISGLGDGDLASSVALGALADETTHVMPWLARLESNEDDLDVEDALAAMVQHCQDRVLEEAQARGIVDHPVGTTMTLAYVSWPRLYVAHVGDSRCYLLRDGSLRRLTADHTMAQRLIDRHVLTAENAASTPFRNILVNAVGGCSEDLDIELHEIDLVDGDSILVCTDGLTSAISELAIAAILADSGSASEACQDLIAAALASEAEDNVTAVVARSERD